MTDNSERSQTQLASNQYLAQPVMEWLRERVDGSLAGAKYGEAVALIERLMRENATLRSVCALWGLHEDPRHEDNVARATLSGEPSSAPETSK